MHMHIATRAVSRQALASHFASRVGRSILALLVLVVAVANVIGAFSTAPSRPVSLID